MRSRSSTLWRRSLWSRCTPNTVVVTTLENSSNCRRDSVPVTLSNDLPTAWRAVWNLPTGPCCVAATSSACSCSRSISSDGSGFSWSFASWLMRTPTFVCFQKTWVCANYWHSKCQSSIHPALEIRSDSARCDRQTFLVTLLTNSRTFFLPLRLKVFVPVVLDFPLL